MKFNKSQILLFIQETNKVVYPQIKEVLPFYSNFKCSSSFGIFWHMFNSQDSVYKCDFHSSQYQSKQVTVNMRPHVYEIKISNEKNNYQFNKNLQNKVKSPNLEFGNRHFALLSTYPNTSQQIHVQHLTLSEL